MQTKILVLNVMKYIQKDTGELKTRFGYAFCDSNCIANNDRFKGYGEQADYLVGDKVFNAITTDMIGKVAVATIKEIPNPQSPLRGHKVISELKFDNGKTISLV